MKAKNSLKRLVLVGITVSAVVFGIFVLGNFNERSNAEPTETTHTGDLIISGNDVFIIENTSYLQENGNIFVYDNAKIIIANSTLYVTQHYLQEFYFSLYNNASLEVYGSTIESNYEFHVTFSDNATGAIGESNFIDSCIEIADGAEVEICNSQTLNIFLQEGRKGDYNATASFINSSINSISLQTNYDSSITLSSLSPGHFDNWSLQKDNTIENLSIKLQLFNSYVWHWFFAIGGTVNFTCNSCELHGIHAYAQSNVSLKNSTIDRITLGFNPDQKVILDGFKTGFIAYLELQGKIQNQNFVIENSDVNEGWDIIPNGADLNITDCVILSIGGEHYKDENVTIYDSFIHRIWFTGGGGIFRFANVTVELFHAPMNSNYRLKGTLNFLEKMGAYNNPWYNSTITREFPIIVVNESGAIANTELKLYSTTNELIWNSTTDAEGKASFEIVFGDENYSDTWNLICPNLRISQEVELLTDTPIVVSNISTVYVDDDFNSSTPGWQYDHFDKIQDGINAVKEGGTVYVFNVTYYENILVDKTINLVGEDRNGTIIDGGGNGDVLYISADWVNISGFTIQHSAGEPYAGINLYDVQHCCIENNNISNNDYAGIWLDNSLNNTVSDCKVSSNAHGIVLFRLNSDNTISKCAVSNNAENSIVLWESGNNYNTINDCNIVDNKDGIVISGWNHHNIVENCTITGSFYDGISICDYSHNNSIINNKINNVRHGFDMPNAFDNVLSSNSISNSQRGIILTAASDNIFINNTINSTEKEGIYILNSKSNTFLNTILSYTNGFRIEGETVADYIHEIDASNTINGKPIYYYKNTNGMSVPSDAGQVILVNCTSFVISNVTIENVYNGVELAYCNSCYINNVTSSNNWKGIYLISSNDNYITNSTITNNSGEGIFLSSSNHNFIESNIITDSKADGVILENSSSNIIYENTIERNGVESGYYRNNVWCSLRTPVINISYYLENNITLDFEVDMKYAFNDTLNPNSGPGWGEYGDKFFLGLYHPETDQWWHLVYSVETERSGYSNWRTFNMSELFGEYTNYTERTGSMDTVNELYDFFNSYFISAGYPELQGKISILWAVITNSEGNTYDGLNWSGLYLDNMRMFVKATNETIWENDMESGNTSWYLSNGWESKWFSPSDGYNDWHISSTDYSSSNHAWYCGVEAYGINIGSSSNNNTIYHNNLIDNVRQAYDAGNNTWDNGYPSGGNYWSDFDEPSEGAYDNNSDGIVDTPYSIPGGSNQDRYPLMTPYGVGIIQGRAYDRNGTPISYATIDILRVPSGEHFSVTANESGYYQASLTRTTGVGGDRYYVSVACSGLARGEAKTFACMWTIEAGEIYTVDLYQVGAIFDPLDMEEGNLTNFSATIYDPQLIYDNPGEQFVYIQIQLKENTKSYNVTKEFVESWIQSPVMWEWVALEGEPPYYDLPAVLFAGIAIENETMNIQFMPFATNYGWLQINKGIQGEGNHVFAGIDISMLPGYGIYVAEGNYPPLPDFKVVPSNPTTSDLIIFSASLSQDPDGVIVNYTWNFGDGNISYGQNPTHQYSDDGTYLVNLTVTDDDGATDSITKSVVVSPADTVPPSISNIHAIPDPQQKGNSVNISCSVVDNVGVASVKVNITYPDGSFVNETMSSAGGNVYYYNVSYANEGIYSYFMWACDTSGNCNTSSFHNFHVCNESISYEMNVGENIIFSSDFDVQIGINATGNVTIGVGEYSISMAYGMPSGIVAVGNYIEISVDNESNINWPIYIAIYYTQADLDEAGINENEIIGMYYFDEQAGMWRLYNSTGVNTNDVTINGIPYEGYVWAYAYEGQLSPKVIGGKPSVPSPPPHPPTPPKLPEPDVLIHFDGPHEWNLTHWEITPETLICFDMEVAEDAGIVELYYRINNGSWMRFRYTGCFNMTLGQHYLYYFGVDKYGTCSNVASIAIEVVGNLAPSTICNLNPSLPDGKNGWYISNMTITLTAKDDISGVDSTYFKIDKGNWRKYIEPITISEDGEHTIYFYSIDKAGNKEEAKSTTFKIDKTKPAITFKKPTYGYLYLMGKEILPLKHTIIIGKAMVAIDGNDEISGIDKVEFYVDDELKVTIAKEPYEWTWNEFVFGKHTIKAVAYDNAGNMAIDEQEVIIFNIG